MSRTAISFRQSPGKGFIQSPGKARLSPSVQFVAQAPEIQAQNLEQLKMWPGVRCYNVLGEDFWPVSGTSDNPRWDFTAWTGEEKLNALRRFRTRTVRYNGMWYGESSQLYHSDPPDVPTSYGVEDTLIGVGYSPRTTGWPSFVPYYETPNWTSPGTLYNPLAVPPVPFPLVPNSSFDSLGNGLSLQTPTLSGAAWTSASPFVTSLTETLTDELTVNPELSTAVARLTARIGYFDSMDWVDPLTGGTTFDAGAFNEPQMFVSLPTADFTGAPYEPHNPLYLEPFYPLDRISDYLTPTDVLCCVPRADIGGVRKLIGSCWVYPTWLDTYQSQPWHSNTLLHAGESRLFTCRMRFRVHNRAATAFVLRGKIYVDQVASSTAGAPVLKLYGVEVVTLPFRVVSDQVVNIGVPFSAEAGYGTFEAVPGTDEVSCGAVAWAVIDETPEHWAARMGVSL